MRPLPTFTTAAAAAVLLGLGALGFTARRRPARDHA